MDDAMEHIERLLVKYATYPQYVGKVPVASALAMFPSWWPGFLCRRVELHEVYTPLAPATRLDKLQMSLRATLHAADPARTSRLLGRLAETAPRPVST